MSIKQAAALLLATALSGKAAAADLSPPASPVVAPSSWTFAVTAYGWAAGLDGKQALFGLPAIDVNLKFSDVLPALDFTASAIIEVRKGRLGFLGEANFVKLSADQTGPAGFVRLKLGSSAFFGLAAGTYRVAEGDWGHIDVVGGAKIFSFSNKASLSGPAPLPLLVGRENESWVDATIGIKARYNLSPQWYLTGWGMAGAGGSNFHWDTLAAVGYQFNQNWSATLGYRAIAIDYKSSRLTYDVIQHGPIVGVTARF